MGRPQLGLNRAAEATVAEPPAAGAVPATTVGAGPGTTARTRSTAAVDVMEGRTLQSVGIGELVVAAAPAVLVAIGLGSCVGVALYDPRAAVGALAHVFLPEAPREHRRPEIRPATDGNGQRGVDGGSGGHAPVLHGAPAKFADVAVPLMVERLVAAGASTHTLRAKLAGGARVLAPLAPVNGGQDVGSRNVEAVRRLLASMKIPIASESVGGDAGRTVRFDVGTGTLEIRSLGRRIGRI